MRNQALIWVAVAVWASVLHCRAQTIVTQPTKAKVVGAGQDAPVVRLPQRTPSLAQTDPASLLPSVLRYRTNGVDLLITVVYGKIEVKDMTPRYDWFIVLKDGQEMMPAGTNETEAAWREKASFLDQSLWSMIWRKQDGKLKLYRKLE